LISCPGPSVCKCTVVGIEDTDGEASGLARLSCVPSRSSTDTINSPSQLEKKDSEMVDKRSLRSSKKDTQETPAEDDKPKPTRTRSARSRKPTSGKSQETTSTSGTDDSAAPPSNQSEDVVMETESVAPEKGGDEDVEMKNSETVEEHKDDVALSPFAGKLLPFDSDCSVPASCHRCPCLLDIRLICFFSN
jgi:hypothetical protein